jgi:hypothetical protein
MFKGITYMEFLCEYTVDRKKEGAYKFLKPLIFSMWFIVPIILMIICVGIGNTLGGIGGLFKAAVFIVPILTAGLAKFFAPITMAYGEIAYEYTIVSGEISFAKIFGNRLRREWFKVKLTELEKCGPYDADAKKELKNSSFNKVYMAASSENAERIYYLVGKNEKGETCLVIFEVIKKSLRMIKTYHPQTKVIDLPF